MNTSRCPRVLIHSHTACPILTILRLVHFFGLDEGLSLGGHCHRKVNSCVPRYINDNSRRQGHKTSDKTKSAFAFLPSHLFSLVGKWAFHVVEMQYSVPCQLQSYHCPYLFPGNDILQDPNVVREPPLTKSTKLSDFWTPPMYLCPH